MIKTARLTLRRWYPTDLPSLDVLLGDPDVMEFSDHGLLTTQEQSDWLNAILAEPKASDLPGTLAIDLNQHIIGYVSLRRDASRVGINNIEIGFRLVKSAWGQGYATEAVVGAIKSVSGLKPGTTIVAIVDPHNRRSLKLLRNTGFRHDGEIMFESYDYPDYRYVRTI